MLRFNFVIPYLFTTTKLGEQKLLSIST